MANTSEIVKLEGDEITREWLCEVEGFDGVKQFVLILSRGAGYFDRVWAVRRDKKRDAWKRCDALFEDFLSRVTVLS